MAYDIGQGISDALGSVAEGMLTRKERKEERELALGQAEMIEDDLYSQYQNLLNTGASESQVKAAQIDYEKWTKATSEDESTKKIEGMLQEYDKGVMRKSRRLQNRQIELENELAETQNPILAKTKIAELDKITNANLEFERKADERKNLVKFRKGYRNAVNAPISDTETFLEDTSTPEFYYKQFNDDRDLSGSEIMYNEIADPASGFKVPKDSPRGRELMGQNLQEGEINPYLNANKSNNPYADIPNRNAFGLEEDPNMGYVPNWKSQNPFFQQTERTRDIMRNPTEQEQAFAAQEYLSANAGKLGDMYSQAEEFVQNRNPRAIKGAKIQLDGEDTGKYIVKNQVLTERVKSAMGITGQKQGMFLKGTTQTIDPVDGSVKTTLNYAPGRDPRDIPDAEEYTKQHSDLKFKTNLATSEQEAKDFRLISSDADHGIQLIQEALDLDSELNPLTRRSSLTLAGANTVRAKIKAKLNLLRGKLRLAVIGPGAVSEYEQKILLEVIGDPTKFFQFDESSRARMTELQRIMAQGIKVRGEKLGLWDYDHKLREGEKLAKKEITFTEDDQANYERKIKSGESVGTSSEIPPALKFNSIKDTLQSGMSEGSTVYIRDIAAGGYRPYTIPETSAGAGNY